MGDVMGLHALKDATPAADWVACSDLIEWDRNPKLHDESNVKEIARSIRRFDFGAPIVAWRSRRQVVAGHGRLRAAALLMREDAGRLLATDAPGPGLVPVRWIEFANDAEAAAYAVADNRLTEVNPMDDAAVAAILREIDEQGGSVEGLGYDEALAALLEDADPPEARDSGGSLSDRFVVPPFSVLDSRQGYWQDRKRRWLGYGLRSHEGRGDAHPGGSPRPAARLGPAGKTERGDGVGRGLARMPAQDLMRGERAAADRESNLTGAPKKPEWATSTGTENMAPGTSIFDPVLCELAYRWFAPKGGTILDPFAGGSVRGVVAAALGYQYVGVDLRPEQVDANRRQWDELERHWPHAAPPVWHCSDSRLIPNICHDVQADMVFSCPPYADLEVYSDNPQDLSTLSYPAFRDAYRDIIAHCAARLKQDRFACFVVGDVRDSKGFYLNFPADTIAAFQDAGCILYNEAIIVTAIGSLPLRVGKQFSSGRKLGKTHQNILIFYKGDPKNIKDTLGDVDVELPEDENATIGD